MREADLGAGLDHLIDKNTPSFGIRGRYPNGKLEIFAKMRTLFEAQWEVVNVINPTARDSEGKLLKGSLIVELKGGKSE